MTNPWAAIIGPCYTRSSLARALRWTEQQVVDAVGALDVLEIVPVDGQALYPAFQVSDGRIVSGLGEVLRTLHTGTDSRWTWAQWLNTPVDDETGQEGRRAIEQLRAGEIDDVLLDARHAAASWRG